MICENPLCEHRKEQWLYEVHPHHIIYKSQKQYKKEPWFETPENKIGLCVPCHNWVHRSRLNMLEILDAMKVEGSFRFDHPFEILCNRYR